MLQDDDKARLSVILTAILRVTEAKHALQKAVIQLTLLLIHPIP